jgi:poly(3-hydroxybutyrate) depolymerase
MRTQLLAILSVTASMSCSSSSSDSGGESGSGTGGSSASSSGEGGASAGSGAAGSAAVGSAGTTGGTVGDGAAAGGSASLGCGSENAPTSGRYTIDVGGSLREYILDVPSDYDPNKPYKLVFAWHFRGGNAQGIADGGYYGLKTLANQSAIFVAAEGIDAGWANPGDRDIAFTRAMVERFKNTLCVDGGRIFSVGWSYGGMFSFALGCGMADVFRAIAPMSGSLWSGCADGTDPIAAWIAHGTYDDVVGIDAGRQARDVVLARNHCSQDTVATDPTPCVAYQGCDAGYPVVWCEWGGGHGTPDFAPAAIWDFFSQF